MENEKRICPFCSEEIDLNATKCPHCDEDLTVENKGEKSAGIFCKCNIIKKFNLTNCVRVTCAVIIFAAIFMICSEKYNLEELKSGIYRINKITGNVQVLENTKFIEVTKANKVNFIDKIILSKLKSFEPKTAKSKIICNFKYMWKDGNLYYKFSASPFNDELKKAKNGYGNKFIILLTDKDDFVLKQIYVNIGSMTSIVDSSNNTHSLEASDNIEISPDIVKAVKDWEVKWDF